FAADIAGYRLGVRHRDMPLAALLRVAVYVVGMLAVRVLRPIVGGVVALPGRVTTRTLRGSALLRAGLLR
ncbi:hypothetical protein IAI17_43755, partial [Escherichia coli]|nr:hypothetical protein [Escherichia coli]